MQAFVLSDSIGKLVFWIGVPLSLIFLGFVLYALCWFGRAISGKDDALLTRSGDEELDSEDA